MTQKTWNGSTGQFTDDASWSPTGTPQSGDTAIISSGTVLANGLTISGIGIMLQSTASTGGTLGLVNTTLASTSTLTSSNSNTYSAGTSPILNVQGTSTNNGLIAFTGSVTFVQISATSGSGIGTLVNNGTITLSGASPQFQAATGSLVPDVTNNGTIAVSNPGNVFQSPVFGATIDGTGSITIGANGKLDLQKSVGSGQTLTFTGGVGAGSILQVDAPASFNATISQFLSGDTITVTNTPYTTFTYASTSASSGVLSLYNGSALTGQLIYSGVYSQSTFSAAYTDLGGGNSTLAITTSVTNSSTGATAGGGTAGTTPTTVGAVYRFFDNKFGTHFFTSDIGERNTVLATRSADLVQETNGFGDVIQTSPSAVAVYRFFDTTFGTHFFTANAGERDTIINTRKDLTYESNSTFYEHSAQQGGDTAVYRLFDTKTGTQFLTGDQGEYRGLTTAGSATYRADLRSEGVAFYAPTGTFT